MSVNITFDGAPESGVIDFGVGQPSADLLPLRRVRAASERFFAHAQPIELNYGEKPGDSRFRTALAEFLTRAGGHAASADSLFLTAGTSQALDFVCQRFTRPGDTVFVEEPSYFLAFQIFRDHGLDIVGIPLDGVGLDVDALEREIARRRPKLVYTIPSFNNPTGQTMSRERRERLVRPERRARFHHCRRRGLPAAALREAAAAGARDVGGPRQRALAGLVLEDRRARHAARLDPDRRCADPAPARERSHHQRRLLQSLRLARRAADARGRLARGAARRVCVCAYAARVAAMDEALHEHLGGIASWQKPEGGYFFWVTLRAPLDAETLREAARTAGTGYQLGSKCSIAGGMRNCLRLSFAYYTAPEIREGIKRLGAAALASATAALETAHRRRSRDQKSCENLSPTVIGWRRRPYVWTPQTATAHS